MADPRRITDTLTEAATAARLTGGRRRGLLRRGLHIVELLDAAYPVAERGA